MGLMGWENALKKAWKRVKQAVELGKKKPGPPRRLKEKCRQGKKKNSKQTAPEVAMFEKPALGRHV